jgi:hypothetical protein
VAAWMSALVLVTGHGRTAETPRRREHGWLETAEVPASFGNKLATL